MKRIYFRQLDGDLDGDLYYLCSVLRSLLQVVSVVAMEVVRRRSPVSDIDVDLKRLVDRFGAPSDGLPVEIIGSLVPVIRSYVHQNCLDGWFEFDDELGKSLSVAVNEWVEFRNNHPGHGVVDRKLVDKWAPLLRVIIRRAVCIFDDLLPVVSGGMLRLPIAERLEIKTPLVSGGDAFVIRSISVRKGVWRMRCQTLSWDNSREVVVDLPGDNLFSSIDSISDKFILRDVFCESGDRLVFHNLPVRQTANFVGRKKELDKLTEWISGVDEWNSCLVYGDGGYGKTTLVLEFMNSLLDGDVNVEIPSVISFYTAKKTKWTEDGVVHLAGVRAAAEDAIRELMYLVYPVLSRDWYQRAGRELVDKAVEELRSQGFLRNDLIIIFDNTETLASSVADAEDLADFLSYVARRLGRVVVTSRRRELMAAIPVPVGGLDPVEALDLIKRIGCELSVASIKQSGDSRLRKACEQVMYKPILIETLVRYLARSSVGVEEGLGHILSKTNDQLLEFLYEDAWERMSNQIREVFVVLVSVVVPLDSRVVGDVCRSIGVLHAEFLSSLDETYFATITRMGNEYEIEIVDLARNFFLKKKSSFVSSSLDRINGFVNLADKNAKERHDIERAYLKDRVWEAYSSSYAKAAKMAVMRRDFPSAKSSFELAVIEEPLNSALYERFASFLLRNMNDEGAALSYALRAVELNGENSDAWLTLALVHYKMGQLKDGDDALDEAFRCGKSESLCLLRKAIARFHISKKYEGLQERLAMLVDAEFYINNSIKFNRGGDFYSRKNLSEAEKYLPMIKSSKKSVRAKLSSAASLV